MPTLFVIIVLLAILFMLTWPLTEWAEHQRLKKQQELRRRLEFDNYWNSPSAEDIHLTEEEWEFYRVKVYPTEKEPEIERDRRA